jgi:Nucleotidyl transferase AbiEii toxin, Type IV TA system
MNPAIRQMLEKYPLTTVDGSLRAVREILQELALLGLWRAKFFEHAAFYGGTALRILHGLDRFSEDLDFSLLKPNSEFDLEHYSSFLRDELAAFGFDVRVDMVDKAVPSPIKSAFLKANTRNELLVVDIPEPLLRQIPKGQQIKIKLEIDTDPPSGFSTEARFVLLPVPFSVRAYSIPDLFAGKMHALLFRRWKTRVKGRDWYDFVWFAANHPALHLAHLEERMRQSGDWSASEPLSPDAFRKLLHTTINGLDVKKARSEVIPFITDPRTADVWSVEFFLNVADRIEIE